jgi:multiple sugar transport system ATP-binding protein
MIVNLPEDISKALKDKKDVPRKVLLGIRPENILLADKNNSNSLKADVKVTEMMGSEIHIHTECLGNTVILRVQVADMTDAEQIELLKKKELSFSFRERTVNIFNPEDGTNLAVEGAVSIPK